MDKGVDKNFLLKIWRSTWMDDKSKRLLQEVCKFYMIDVELLSKAVYKDLKIQLKRCTINLKGCGITKVVSINVK